jgi:hypothetical protein
VGNNIRYKVSQIEDYYKVSQVEDYYKIKMITSVGNWYLSSKDELNQMHAKLHLSGLGGFSNAVYLSSSESSATLAWGQDFTDGSQSTQVKSILSYVRPSRIFVADPGIFRLQDKGPGGGYIYYIDGDEYYEAYPTDISTGYYWSNIQSTAIGTTGTAIGTGLANTTAIIAQSGHITSAAELCRLLNPGTFSEWFLPNDSEQSPMYTNLKAEGLGGFASDQYWGSRERNATEGFGLSFVNGSVTNASKAGLRYVRACRTFRSNTVYALRDIGPGGGYIFYIDNGQYYEENGADLSTAKFWSNINNVEIGATAQNTAIGTGILNTAAIIGQAGHTDSAAKLCNDYSV